jgi:hypothetical protein
MSVLPDAAERNLQLNSDFLFNHEEHEENKIFIFVSGLLLLRSFYFKLCPAFFVALCLCSENNFHAA